MSRSLAAGVYPDGVGTHQIFGNVRKDPNNVLAMARPLAVVVAGLGEEGKLRAVDLVYTVRQAVIAYAQRLAEKGGGAPAEFELAATLIGSGGTGISAGTSAQLVAQGTWRSEPEAARQRLAAGRPPDPGRVLSRPRERRLARARRCRRRRRRRSSSSSATSSRAPARCAARSTRATAAPSYDFISATVGKPDDGGLPTITYTLDTKRARTEVRAQQTQATLVKELVAKASNSANRDAQIGRTLFDLLVPVEMEPFLGGTTRDGDRARAGHGRRCRGKCSTPSSAEIAQSDPRPWAIRCKLLRKLRTEEFRAQRLRRDRRRQHPRDRRADGRRGDVPAAARRARRGGRGGDAAHGGTGGSRRRASCAALTSGNDDARNIINALFERPTGSSTSPATAAPRRATAASCSRAAPISARPRSKAMRVVPELVFLNCCHLAAFDARAGARAVRPRRVRGDDRRGADRGRRSLRDRRRLGGRGQAGRDLRDHLLRRAARRQPLHRRRRRRAHRRLAHRRRRQHVVGVPVLRRSGLDVAARRRRRAAAERVGRATSSPASRRRRR